MTTRTDAAAVIASTDLLRLIGADTPLKKVAHNEYAGPCGRCGGSDRLHVNPVDGWWFCRQCQPKRGDAAGYLQWRDGLSYPQALDALDPTRRKELPMRSPTPRAITPPSDEWQWHADDLVCEAQATLWSPAGDAARSYLHKRGLTDATLLQGRLGYVPKEIRRDGLLVPAGILIPWYDGSTLWQLKIRRRSGSVPKYLAVAGGHPFLYAPASLPPDGPLLLVEGEFDALLCWQELDAHAPGLCAVASLGSASVAQDGLDLALGARLRQYAPLLLGLDADAAGAQGAAALLGLLPGSALAPIPQGNDPTDFHLQGGLIREWVEFYLRLATRAPGSTKEDGATQDGPPVVAPAVSPEPAETDDLGTAPAPEPCDRAWCRNAADLPRDPDTGAWCSEHWLSAQLLDAALVQDWPALPQGPGLATAAADWYELARTAPEGRLQTLRDILWAAAAPIPSCFVCDRPAAHGDVCPAHHNRGAARDAARTAGWPALRPYTSAGEASWLRLLREDPEYTVNEVWSALTRQAATV